MLNEKQISELGNALKEYEGKDLVISSWIENKVYESYSSETLENSDIEIFDNGVKIESEANEDCKSFLFDLIDGEELYININKIIPRETTIAILFTYNGINYSIVNLV